MVHLDLRDLSLKVEKYISNCQDNMTGIFCLNKNRKDLKLHKEYNSF